MSASEWGVVVGSVALIAGELWWFLGGRRGR